MLPGNIGLLSRVRFPPSGTAPGNVDGPASSTNNALVLFNGTTGKIIKDSVDLTYVSPTLSVPDAFVVSSAGSIGLTAGGSNKSITLTPSGSGVVTTPATIQLSASNGVICSNTADGSDSKFISFGGGGAATAARGALFNAVGNEFATAAAQGILEFIAGFDSGFSSASAGRISLVTANIEAGFISRNGTLAWGSNRSIAAWGTTAPIFMTGTPTLTDSSSATGTVATAIANGFGIPTLNATNANVIYTNLANVYIAGDFATTGNASATNSYGLWNAGKTRLDGNALITGTSTWKFGATSSATIGVSADTTAGVLTLTAPSSGTISLTKSVSSYNGAATAGGGLVAIRAAGRVTAQSAANASISTFTVGAADGSFEVSANMNVTAATVLSTALTCTYTDESNTARTMIFPVAQVAGSFIAAGAITGTGAWESPVLHIRCKAATAITILTSAGTFNTVTYTAEGVIKQVA